MRTLTVMCAALLAASAWAEVAQPPVKPEKPKLSMTKKAFEAARAASAPAAKASEPSADVKLIQSVVALMVAHPSVSPAEKASLLANLQKAEADFDKGNPPVKAQAKIEEFMAPRQGYNAFNAKREFFKVSSQTSKHSAPMALPQANPPIQAN